MFRYSWCSDSLDWSYGKFRPRNKVSFDVSKNISHVMNDPMFLRCKIGLKNPFITWVYVVIVSSESSHNLYLLFSSLLSIFALIWLVLMALFCAPKHYWLMFVFFIYFADWFILPAKHFQSRNHYRQTGIQWWYYAYAVSAWEEVSGCCTSCKCIGWQWQRFFQWFRWGDGQTFHISNG